MKEEQDDLVNPPQENQVEYLANPRLSNPMRPGLHQVVSDVRIHLYAYVWAAEL